MTSPFLALPESAHVAANALAFAVRDGFPVSEGHTLVVPRRLVPTWFDATADEQRAMMELVDVVKRQLDARVPPPDGYNVGFNAGEAAGQTVMHLHVHVIPRWRGDVDDPRGGVRHVIPSKANYLAPAKAEVDPAFVEKVLTLLDQAQYTTTYKYAVMLALVDLCMERATADGAPPTSVTTRQLAERVLALYWPQAATFRDTATVLRQNADRAKDARLLTLIRAFRDEHAPDPTARLAKARAAAPAAFDALLREVEWTLVLMPLPRVQTLPGNVEDRFLYDIAWSLAKPVTQGAFRRNDFDNVIRFMPGAAEQLVALSTMVRPLVQRQWAAKVARMNADVVTDAGLEEFLFGATRVSLAPVRGPLVELHDGRCFYCGDRLGRAFDIDHFIAWSRHPDDAIENLVPAHVDCNGSKSDHLAAAAHVARWVSWSRARTGDLHEIARRASWEHDGPRTLAVARVIYLRLRADVRLWRDREGFEKADRAALALALAG